MKEFDKGRMFTAILGLVSLRKEARQKQLKDALRPYYSGNQVKTGIYLLEQKGLIEFSNDREYSYMRLTRKGSSALAGYMNGSAGNSRAG